MLRQYTRHGATSARVLGALIPSHLLPRLCQGSFCKLLCRIHVMLTKRAHFVRRGTIYAGPTCCIAPCNAKIGSSKSVQSSLDGFVGDNS